MSSCHYDCVLPLTFDTHWNSGRVEPHLLKIKQVFLTAHPWQWQLYVLSVMAEKFLTLPYKKDSPISTVKKLRWKILTNCLNSFHKQVSCAACGPEWSPVQSSCNWWIWLLLWEANHLFLYLLVLLLSCLLKNKFIFVFLEFFPVVEGCSIDSFDSLPFWFDFCAFLAGVSCIDIVITIFSSSKFYFYCNILILLPGADHCSHRLRSFTSAFSSHILTLCLFL